jgi:hypothetical protein
MVEDQEQDALPARAMVNPGTHQGSLYEVKRLDRVFNKTLLQLFVGKMFNIKNLYLNRGV